jgi:RimJ/RimL family protein N-acetyltransferase
MSDITLRPLSLEDMEVIRNWRHQVMETLRTPYMLTAEQQADYYIHTICDRRGTTRYWGFWADKVEPMVLVGMGGIENIQWENRTGEISVLISSQERGKGYGRAAVDAILDQAFNHLNLETVYGECYKCSAAVPFWEKLVDERSGYLTLLPMRKYWNGAYWDAIYFTFYKAKK